MKLTVRGVSGIELAAVDTVSAALTVAAAPR